MKSKYSTLAKGLHPYIERWIDDKVSAALTRTVIVSGRGGGSGGGGSYTAGDAIDIDGSNIISVDISDLIGVGASAYGMEEDGATNNFAVKLDSPSGLGFDGADGSLSMADSVAGAGLAIGSKVLSVDIVSNGGLDAPTGALEVDVTDFLGFGLTESADSPINVIDVDLTEDFAWTGAHSFATPGLSTWAITLTNTGPGSHVAAGGLLYYDQTVLDADLGGSGILESNTRGGLMLYNAGEAAWGLSIDTLNMDVVNVEFPSVTTDYLYADANLMINPTGYVQYPNSQISRTTSYENLFAGIEGFSLWEPSSGVSQLTIGKILVDELHAKIFVADETRVDRGKQLWSKSFGIVASNFLSPAIGSTVDAWFEDSPDISGSLFSVGDWLLIRSIDWSTGIDIYKVWYTVTASLSDVALDDGGNAKDWQKWTITRESGGYNNLVIKAGVVAVDVGVAGQGFVELSALESDDGPWIQMGDWDSAPNVISNWNVYARMGNLNGLVGNVADTWGFAAGNNLSSATTSDWEGIVADTSGVSLYNASISSYNASGVETARLTNEGNLRLGTDVDAGGSGISLMFTNSSGDLRLGDVNAGYMLWDKSAQQLQFRDATDIQAYVDTDGKIYAGDGAVWLDKDGIDIEIATISTIEPPHSLRFMNGSTECIVINAQLYSGINAVNLDAYYVSTYDSSSGLRAFGPSSVVAEISASALTSGSTAVELKADSIDLQADYGNGTITLAGTVDIEGSITVDGGSIRLDNAQDLSWKDSGGTARRILELNSNDNIIVGESGMTGETIVYPPLRLYNGSAIGSAPPNAGTDYGWKISLYSTTAAIGVLANHVAVRTPNWFSVFDNKNPAGSGSPDNNACLSVNENYLNVTAKLGQAWANVTFSGSWANYNATTDLPVSYKLFGDIVFFRGRAVPPSGTGTATAMFTLPSAYRPDKRVSIPVATYGSGSTRGTGQLIISTAGVVTFYGDATTWLSLDSAMFTISA